MLTEVKKLNMPSNAYLELTSPQFTKSSKDIEYEMIFQITRNLKNSNKLRSHEYQTFASCISKNRELWAILSADVCSPENKYPSDLKAKIFYLGEFVQGYSSQVLSQNLSIDPLVDINLCILRGLYGQGS